MLVSSSSMMSIPTLEAHSYGPTATFCCWQGSWPVWWAWQQLCLGAWRGEFQAQRSKPKDIIDVRLTIMAYFDCYYVLTGISCCEASSPVAYLKFQWKNSISPWDHVWFERFHLMCVSTSLFYHLGMGVCCWLSAILEFHSVKYWCSLHFPSSGQKFNISWSTWPSLLVFAAL